MGVPLPVPDGRGVLVAWWTDPTGISGDTLDLLGVKPTTLASRLKKLGIATRS